MKKHLYLLLLVPLFATSVAFSQSSYEHKVNQSLTRDTLSKEQLKAFEKRTEQKLKDFCSYLTLISNPELAEKFRTRSKLAALRLFENEQVLVCCSLDGLISTDSTSITDYLTQLEKNTKTAFACTFSDFRVINSFHKTSQGFWQATMSFQLSDSGNPSTVVVYLKRALKSYGSQQDSTWTVLLGAIY